MKTLQRRPHHVRNYFKHEAVAYAVKKLLYNWTVEPAEVGVFFLAF